MHTWQTQAATAVPASRLGVCLTDTKTFKLTGTGPGPRINKGVNFPGLLRHEGQHACQEVFHHLPGSGEPP